MSLRLTKKTTKMTSLMKAVCKVPGGGVALREVPRPEEAKAGHLLIKMKYSAIGHGDKAFLNQPLPPGSVESLLGIYGASGVGEVLETGEGAPPHYLGRNVTIYRSLHNSNTLIGCWSEYAHIHWLDCVIIPDEAKPEEYSGSLANIITPYAFRMESLKEGHTGIISTAGTSTTGIMMLGIALKLGFPLISMVRNQAGKRLLESLGATHVVVQEEADFDTHLKDLAFQLQTTAVYDALGGTTLNRIIDLLPNGSTIYSYGFLGDDVPLTIFMRQILFKRLTIKSFGNINTQTVRDPQQLAEALNLISDIIGMPHFKTNVGQKFPLKDFSKAIDYFPAGTDKAILVFEE
jgi:NADPH2:quinone reductase